MMGFLWMCLISAYLNVLCAQHTVRTVLQTHTHTQHMLALVCTHALTHMTSLQIHSLTDPQTFQCYASKFLNHRWIYIYYWWPTQSGLLLTVDCKQLYYHEVPHVHTWMAWVAQLLLDHLPPILQWNGHCKVPILTRKTWVYSVYIGYPPHNKAPWAQLHSHMHTTITSGTYIGIL